VVVLPLQTNLKSTHWLVLTVSSNWPSMVEFLPCLNRPSVHLSFVHLSVCLSVYLHVYLHAYLSTCLSIYMPIYLHVSLSTCLSIYMTACLPACQPASLLACPLENTSFNTTTNQSRRGQVNN
jgi:hypothetical protein